MATGGCDFLHSNKTTITNQHIYPSSKPRSGHSPKRQRSRTRAGKPPFCPPLALNPAIASSLGQRRRDLTLDNSVCLRSSVDRGFSKDRDPSDHFTGTPDLRDVNIAWPETWEQAFGFKYQPWHVRAPYISTNTKHKGKSSDVLETQLSCMSNSGTAVQTKTFGRRGRETCSAVIKVRMTAERSHDGHSCESHDSNSSQDA